MDGNDRISQTNTILRYIARKCGLPSDSGSEHLTDLLCDQVTDLESKLAGLMYEEGRIQLIWYRLISHCS